MNPVQGAVAPAQQYTGFQQGSHGTVQQVHPAASSVQGVIAPAQQMPGAQQDIDSLAQQMVTQFSQLNTAGVSQGPLVDDRQPAPATTPVVVRVEFGQLQVINHYGTVAPATPIVHQAPSSAGGFSQRRPSASVPVADPFRGSQRGSGSSRPQQQRPPARGQRQRGRRGGRE